MVCQAEWEALSPLLSACLAVCDVSEVVIVTIFCHGKSKATFGCFITVASFFLKMTPEHITQPFPIQGLCIVESSPAPELLRNLETRFSAFKRALMQRSQKIALCYNINLHVKSETL